MPGYFVEGNTAQVCDSEQRSLQKWNSLLYDAHGNIGDVPFPEGTRPLASDDEHRSEVKINAILKATA